MRETIYPGNVFMRARDTLCIGTYIVHLSEKYTGEQRPGGGRPNPESTPETVVVKK